MNSDGLVGVAERFLKKGSKVYIEGQLRTRKWQDASGNDRYTTEVSVAGFDDTPTARVVWPPLTTVRQPINEMAAAAADILISGEARRAMDDKLPIKRMLDFELIVRQSCAPPKA